MTIWNELHEYDGVEFRPDLIGQSDGASRRMIADLGIDSYLGSDEHLYHLATMEGIGGHGRLYDELRPIMPPPGPVLEMNAGIGSHGMALLARGYEVVFHEPLERLRGFLEWRVGEAAEVVAEVDERYPFAFSFAGPHRYPQDAQVGFVTLMAAHGELCVLLIREPVEGSVLYPCDWRALSDEIADRYTVFQSVTYDGSWRRIAFVTPTPYEPDADPEPQDELEVEPEEPPEEVAEPEKPPGEETDETEIEEQEDEP